MLAKEQLMLIRSAFYAGKLTYDEAKVKAQPFLDEINKQAVIIAKKHNQKPFKASFAGVMR